MLCCCWLLKIVIWGWVKMDQNRKHIWADQPPFTKHYKGHQGGFWLKLMGCCSSMDPSTSSVVPWSSWLCCLILFSAGLCLWNVTAVALESCCVKPSRSNCTMWSCVFALVTLTTMIFNTIRTGKQTSLSWFLDASRAFHCLSSPGLAFCASLDIPLHLS